MNRISPFPGMVDPIAYVRSLACQVAAMYPSCLHLEDVAAEGLLALVMALRRFDVRRGVRFSTFAWARVRGAMVDLVRAESRRRRFVMIQDLPDLPGDASVEDDAIDREIVDHLHQGVSLLPARQSQYLHGLLGGHPEVHVCRGMGITRGAGRELRERAVANLRRRLCVDQKDVISATA